MDSKAAMHSLYLNRRTQHGLQLRMEPLGSGRSIQRVVSKADLCILVAYFAPIFQLVTMK
eukprot:scaffold23796_cov17-Prasinocladus_malaysianus.AAC.1